MAAFGSMLHTVWSEVMEGFSPCCKHIQVEYCMSGKINIWKNIDNIKENLLIRFLNSTLDDLKTDPKSQTQ